jgi:hypothetical protein
VRGAACKLHSISNSQLHAAEPCGQGCCCCVPHLVHDIACMGMACLAQNVVVACRNSRRCMITNCSKASQNNSRNTLPSQPCSCKR